MFIDGSTSDVTEKHIKLFDVGPCCVYYDLDIVREHIIKYGDMEYFNKLCTLKNKGDIMAKYINGDIS